MTIDPKRLPVRFYATGNGHEPVREWLLDLSVQDRQTVGIDIKTVEYGWPIGMPVCRPLTGHKGLWEVRSTLSGGRIARVIFCVRQGQMVLLHGFIKKTQKTPSTDLDLASRRMKDLSHDH